MSDYSVIAAAEAEDAYEGTDVPGEFRKLSGPLGCSQLGLTQIRIPPHSDFDQGTGHFHDEIEEVYLVTAGTLTMRLDDDVVEVPAGSVVRVAPPTVRSYRNLGEDPVELWALSRQLERGDATKVEEFWEADPGATRHGG